MTAFTPGSETRVIHQDIVAQTTTFDIVSDSGEFTFDEIGTRQSSVRTKTYSIHRDDPTSCRSAVHFVQVYQRDDWNVRIETEIVTTCDRTHFHFTGSLKAHDGDEVFATREYREKIKRDCM